MSERTLKRIGMVLAILVLAWIVVTVTSGGPPEPGEAGGEMATFLEGLAPDAATAVVFSGGGPEGQTVRLERGPGGAAPEGGGSPTGWTVDGHPADSAQVARFLTALGGAGTGAPVSVNPANHERMGVDEASARVLVIEGPEGPDSLLVGGSGPGAGTVYARLPGRDEVHVVRADLSSHASRSATDWRSRRMAAADTSTLTALEVSREGTTYRMERPDSAWFLDGGTADADRLRSLLGEMARLDAQGFPESPAEGAAGEGVPEREPDRTSAAWDAEELALTVRFWEPEEDAGPDWIAVVEGPAALQPGVPFTLPSWRVDRVTPAREEVVGSEEGDG